MILGPWFPGGDPLIRPFLIKFVLRDSFRAAFHHDAPGDGPVGVEAVSLERNRSPLQQGVQFGSGTCPKISVPSSGR